MKFSTKTLILILSFLSFGQINNLHPMEHTKDVKNFIQDIRIRGLNFNVTIFLNDLLKHKTFSIINNAHHTQLIAKQVSAIFKAIKECFPEKFTHIKNLTLENCNLVEMPDLFYELNHLIKVDLKGNEFDDATKNKIIAHCEKINQRRKNQKANTSRIQIVETVELTFN